MDNFNLKKYLAEGRLFEQEQRDIEDILVKAGFDFEDGLLGGVGSGGGGYYDYVSDRIVGIQFDKFNEEEFNKWYDNFSKEDFSEFIHEKEFAEENEDPYDYDMVAQMAKPGIYSVGEMGYAEIHNNGDIQLFSPPTLGDDNFENDLEPIFTMDSSGNAVPAMDKEEVKTKVQQGHFIL